MRWLCIFSLLLSACSGFGDFIYRPSPQPGSDNTQAAPTTAALSEEEKNKLSRRFRSRYEWAVQYYESGEYDKAKKSFLSLTQAGALLEEFELVPFYLGMSEKKLGNCPAAIAHLQNFKKSSRMLGDARLAQMECLEQMSEWKKITALAAEMEKASLLQEQRVDYLLFWSRALTELGELQGAKSRLEEAENQIFNQPGERRESQRFALSRLAFDLKTCSQLPYPKKKAPWQNWVIGRSECEEQSLRYAGEKLFGSDSAYAQMAYTLLEKSSRIFVDDSRGLAKNLNLRDRRKLRDLTQKSLYRLYDRAGTIENALQKQMLITKHLEQLKKHWDGLLSELTQPYL